jgi:hypothetical protein
MTTNTNTTAQPILTSKDILDSFTVGQGKTNDLDLNSKVTDKIALHGLTVKYQGLDLIFQSQAHLDAYFLNILYSNIRSKSLEDIAKLFAHLNSGNYLSLNHKDNKPETNIQEQFKELFEAITMVSLERASTKSKIYSMVYKVTLDNNAILIKNGFKLHLPIVDSNTFQVVGFNITLPEKD